jgi:hypothetical protein
MLLRVLVVTCTVIVAYPYTAVALEDSYDCVSTAHTNVGWSVSRKAYTAEAVPKIARPSTVKLSGMASGQPFMTGQGVAKLQRLSTDGATTWFAEKAAAGTMIVWTFFPQQGADGVPTAVLISSKSYDLFGGPVNFTDVYACKPNSAIQRR